MMNRTFNPTFAGRPVTIFAVMSALANKHGAINLGQGFPDEDGPREILEAAARGILEKHNQYTPVMGVPALRQALARANKRFYDLDFDWETETMVACGAPVVTTTRSSRTRGEQAMPYSAGSPPRSTMAQPPKPLPNWLPYQTDRTHAGYSQKHCFL